MSKEQIIEVVKGLPENPTLDDLFEKLVFIEAVEEGIAAAEAGDVMSIDEAERRLGLA